MIVSLEKAHGTIGGGRLELDAIDEARSLLRDGRPSIVREVRLGPSIGQCCGGRVTLEIARADASALADLEIAERQAAAAWPTVLVFGAGHVGRALAPALSLVPFRVRWIDERPAEIAGLSHAENVEVEITGQWDQEIARAPKGAACLVLTHSHTLDSLITAAALARDDFTYVGLIGSLTKRKRFERAFREIGLSKTQIARLVCPIGDFGVRDKRPEIIAALVVAELIQRFALGSHATASGRSLEQT
jgi:xanthine dehydrogenase accessory factor